MFMKEAAHMLASAVDLARAYRLVLVLLMCVCMCSWLSHVKTIKHESNDRIVGISALLDEVRRRDSI